MLTSKDNVDQYHPKYASIMAEPLFFEMFQSTYMQDDLSQLLRSRHIAPQCTFFDDLHHVVEMQPNIVRKRWLNLEEHQTV